jgi:hypothetical protein
MHKKKCENGFWQYSGYRSQAPGFWPQAENLGSRAGSGIEGNINLRSAPSGIGESLINAVRFQIRIKLDELDIDKTVPADIIQFPLSDLMIKVRPGTGHLERDKCLLLFNAGFIS